MSTEPRRAAAAFALYDAAGNTTESGDTLAVIDDDGLSLGPLTVAFLDADALRVADYRVEIDLWPSGRLALTRLGRRFDTFSQELRRAWNRARVAGMLAHGITNPEVFDGAVLDDVASAPAELQVYDTHITIVPQDGLPWQVPFGTLTGAGELDSPPGVALHGVASTTSLGLLARKRDALLAMVAQRLDAERRLLSELTVQDGFADGWSLPRSGVRAFDRLLERFTAPERVEAARTVLAAADGEPRLGFVQLLDPDSDVLRPPAALPAHWAVFLLVPVGRRTVLEILAGPHAATYVFASDVETTNRDLQALHFRRAPLALSADEAELTATNPYRLALRALAPLQRLRASTTARLVHTGGWAEAFRAAIS